MIKKPWELYDRLGQAVMRPYVEGEDLSNVRIGGGGTVLEPELGGMIARSEFDENDQWYVTPEHFRANFTQAEKTDG